MSRKKKGSRDTHAKGLERIVERLKDYGYDEILLNKEYINPVTKQCGEIDIIAFKDNHILIFEYKSCAVNSRIDKATDQLGRAKAYIETLKYINNYKVDFAIHKLYVHGPQMDYKIIGGR